MLLKWRASALAAIALSLWTPTVLADSPKIFYASAVSYCSAARAIQVERFLLEYDSIAKTISFDISAAAVSTNLNAILSFELIAYGINAVNLTINLCDELAGILCPLPSYDFVGSATLPLPASVTDKIKIPGIGYVIPDLEATAYVRLINEGTNTEAACLKVDLSNGRTTRLGYVSWALGAIALLSLLVGVLGAIVSLWKGNDVESGRRKERLVYIITFYQFVVSTGVLSLEYPTVFTSFCANFAWSWGLIFIRPFQVAIDETRSRTGGNLTQVAGNLVGGTRALRNNAVADLSIGPESTNGTAFSTLVHAVVNSGNHLRKRQLASSLYSVPTVSQTDNIGGVPSGLPRFLSTLNISPYNGFMTTFLTFLLFICLFLAVVLLFGMPFFFLTRRYRHKTALPTRGVAYDLLRANALRLLLISWPPLLFMSFFQWTLGRNDSWAPIVLSVFTIIFTTAALLFIALRTFLHFRRDAPPGLGPDKPLYNAFRSTRWWFFLPLLAATFLRAIFVSFAQNHGWAQSVGLLVIESIVFVLACIFTPWTKKSANGVHITILILRIIISGALVSFNASIGLNQIIRVVIGIVIAVIESVVVVGLFLLVLLDAVFVVINLFRKPHFDPVEREKDVSGTNRDARISDSRTLHDDGEPINMVPAEAKTARNSGNAM